MVSDRQSTENGHYPRLKQLLNAGTVRAQVQAGDWKEAIQIAGDLLVKNGSIESRYVCAMERVVRELGPYAVLAPGIVLLHARPEDGVIEPCIGLITLSTAVCFGHTQNDPVDIVFALGAVDKKSHIQALQQLSMLLGEAEFLSRVRSAKNDESLLAVIDTWADQEKPGENPFTSTEKGT